MNPLVIAGGVLVGQYIVEKAGGWPALVGFANMGAKAGSGQTQAPPAGTVPIVNAPGNQAAVAYLVGLGSVSGIPIPPVDPQAPNVTSIWSGMRGNVTSGSDGAALATAFLGAYDAARAADSTTYNMFSSSSSMGGGVASFGSLFNFTPCAVADASQLSSLGAAACALGTDRDAYSGDNSTIITDIATLASEMDNVGYVANENPSILDSINFAVAQLPQTLFSAIGSVVGSIAGSVGSAIIGSPWFWAGALVVVGVGPSHLLGLAKGAIP